MSNITKDLTVELIEKELITVTLFSADIATKTLEGLKNVNITTPVNNDILAYETTSETWINKELSDIVIETEFIFGEIPTNIDPLPSKRFAITNACKTATLQVYFNGIRERNITIHSNTEFSFGIDIINTHRKPDYNLAKEYEFDAFAQLRNP